MGYGGKRAYGPSLRSEARALQAGLCGGDRRLAFGVGCPQKWVSPARLTGLTLQGRAEE